LKRRVFIGSRPKSSLIYFDHCLTNVSAGERNSSKLLRDTRFNSFEFFLRHWSARPSFDEIIEQDLPPVSLCANWLAFSVSAPRAPRINAAEKMLQ
jgi:hypothetical protein